ncbi:hypothetical protein DB346_03410 [Verrucomicrobia bacterium LW23]|nr:hypothetical protein DB346_03410 [Verrucomicrobia bacterium LW23]
MSSSSSSPNLPTHVARRLEAAQGYLDLGMPDDAWLELEEMVQEEGRTWIQVTLFQITLLIQKDDHDGALARAQSLCAEGTEHPQAYIYRSYCLHALHRTEEARDALLAAPDFMRSMALYHYNLGCYECQLGRLEDARRCLRIAIRMLGSYKIIAKDDPDLLPLMDELDEIARDAALVEIPDREHHLSDLSARLADGSDEERARALSMLVEAGAEHVLVDLMKSKDPAVINIAAQGLWACWMDEAGPEARALMERGTDAMNRGDLDLALSIFEKLAREHEDWPEAVNKVATALYKMHRYRESMAACRKVVQAKPFHFGAWSGLAACAMQVGDWKAARLAAEQMLHLQPHSSAHHSLLLEIERRASDASGSV